MIMDQFRWPVQATCNLWHKKREPLRRNRHWWKD